MVKKLSKTQNEIQQAKRSETLQKNAYFKTVFGTTAYGEKRANGKKRIKAALRQAHEIRRFEIRLYWQRSLFFWGFILTLFAGLGLMVTADNQTIFIKFIIVAIALLGLFANCAWFFIERGSKSWQGNWEFHIDYLEDEITGSLHKTIIGKRGAFFSVSKITSWIIVAFGLFWFVVTYLGVAYLFLPISQYELKKLQLNTLRPRLESSEGDLFLIGITLIGIVVVFILGGLIFWKTSSRTLPPKNQNSKLKSIKLEAWKRDFPEANFTTETHMRWYKKICKMFCCCCPE